MAENADGIDESALFTYEPGEEGAPEPAAPPKSEEPPPAKEPEKATEPKAEPEDDTDTLTLDELTASMSEATKKAVAEAIEAERARNAEDPDDDTPQEVKDLRAENARLKAENEAQAKSAAEKAEAAELAKLEHQMASAAGKYKMTEKEIGAVVDYLTANPDLVVGGMGFEEAALRRLPDLRTRLRTEPPAREAPASSAGEPPPAGNGSRAPAPFKHKAEPGQYGDITEHLLKTGQAAALFTKD